MNNLLASTADATTSPTAKIIEAAALVAGALKSGCVKMNDDGSFNLDGIPHAPVLPANGSPTTADKPWVNKFQFDGKNWTLQFDGKIVIEPDRLGQNYIGQFIKNPHKEIHVTNLVTSAYGEPVEIMDEKDLLESGVAVFDNDVDEITGDVNLHVVTTEYRDEILPDEDRAIVLGLLEKAREELATLNTKGSINLIHEKEWEIEEIEKYLAKTRFRGKNTHFDGRAENDRKSVAKAIKDAIGKIAKNHLT